LQNVIIETSAIIERLKQARGHEKDAELARELGVPPKKLGVWKLRNTVPLEELTTFCRQFNYNLEWVLTGEGIKKNQPATVGESETPFEIRRKVDRETRIINQMLEGMTDQQKAEVRKYCEMQESYEKMRKAG